MVNRGHGDPELKILSLPKERNPGGHGAIKRRRVQDQVPDFFVERLHSETLPTILPAS